MARELTVQQRAFLDALFGEAKGDYRYAMNLAGYSKNTPVISVIEGVKEELIEKAQIYLALNAPKAAMAVEYVLEQPVEPGNKEKLAAAREVLDRVGIVKKEEVNVKVAQPGVFILPAKRVEPEDDVAEQAPTST